MKRNIIFTGVLCLAVFLGAGSGICAENDQTAIIATVAPDWGSGAHSVVSVDPVGGPRTVSNQLDPSGSDLSVDAYGNYFYRIEKYNANNVTKYSVDAPSDAIWQYSTEGAEENSNPTDLVFVSSTKAYLLRYGSDTAWIVNPSAETEAKFKTGELDLSAYADTDGIPEMQTGIVVGDRLYVILQRVDFSDFTGSNPEAIVYYKPYIAVFDTATDTEIDTHRGENGLKGIPLPTIRNPQAIRYSKGNDSLYVQGVGDWGASSQAMGGIVRVDAESYASTVVMTDNAGTYGTISGLAIVSPAKGYFIGYAGWGDNTLYSFNPLNGGDVVPVAGFEHLSLAGLDSGVYVDKNDMLWVCNQSDASVDILNTADDTIDESIPTAFNPVSVAFASGDADTEDGGDSGGGGGGCFVGVLR